MKENNHILILLYIIAALLLYIAWGQHNVLKQTANSYVMEPGGDVWQISNDNGVGCLVPEAMQKPELNGLYMKRFSDCYFDRETLKE